MKAIQVHQFGGPDVLKLQEVPDPTTGHGQVVVRVKAVGVNPVDTYIRAGKYGPKQFPYTPGSDAAGTIESVGEGVTRWKPGDRVYTFRTITGAYAEKTLCDDWTVAPLPERATFQQGAGVGAPAGAAWRALFFRGHARPGEVVLVHGASGGVGISAVQLARAAGLIVIATAGTEESQRFVLEQGAHHAAGHDITQKPDRLRSLTGGKSVDLILEMLANTNLGADLKVLAPRSRVIVIGSRGTTEIDPRDTMGPELDIRGMSLFQATREELERMHAALVAALDNGTLRPIVGNEFPLAEAAQAQVAVMEDKARGKIILTP